MVDRLRPREGEVHAVCQHVLAFRTVCQRRIFLLRRFRQYAPRSAGKNGVKQFPSVSFRRECFDKGSTSA